MGSRMPKLGTSGSERGGICEDYRLLTYVGCTRYYMFLVIIIISYFEIKANICIIMIEKITLISLPHNFCVT